MRDDGDFAAYLVARWTPVVGTLVLLGCPQPVAEDIAVSAFARMSVAWRGVRDSDDIEVRAYRVVLQEWRRSRGRPALGAPDERPTPDSRARLEAMLDRLTPEVRAVLLLRFVADLGEAQVGEVMDLPFPEVQEMLASGLGAIDLEALREASR